MKCHECGKESEGRFCSNCGAPLDGVRCAGCDAGLPAGARFCTQCGRPVAARPDSLPWVVMGASLIALIVVLAWPTIAERTAQQPQLQSEAPFASMAGGGGNPPPLTGTPREQADRLFDRAMNERSAGNDEQARFFADMGVRAYRMAEPLDHDALFHLSLLEASMGDATAAASSAERILADAPQHLLALAAGAEAALLAGDTATARDYFSRFLDHYDAEREKQLPEYIDHDRILPEYRSAAEALTGR